MFIPFPGLTLTLHPALPDPRAAERFPSHPTLWAARQRRPRRQHRTRSRAARDAAEAARGRRARTTRRAIRAAASMPVLRRPHDHRRDLRARMPAETPAHTGSRGDQGRHLMTLSPPIDHRYHTCHARWRAAGHAYACIRLIDSMPTALPIVSHHAQPARSPRRAHLCDTANRSQRPPPPNLIKPCPVAKSP